MSFVQYVVNGDPIAKARHRSFLRHGHIQSYDPQNAEKEAIQTLLLYAFKRAVNEKRIESAYTGPLIVEMTFHMPIPKSFVYSQKNKVLWGLFDHTSKPDIDNLAKMYLDCANNILFKDDRQIVKLYLEKTYSAKPRTVINIMCKEPPTLANHLQEILGVLGPDEIEQLIKDTQELAKIYEELKRENDQFSFRNPTLFREQKLAELASLLGDLASKYSVSLKKVAKIAQ